MTKRPSRRDRTEQTPRTVLYSTRENYGDDVEVILTKELLRPRVRVLFDPRSNFLVGCAGPDIIFEFIRI